MVGTFQPHLLQYKNELFALTGGRDAKISKPSCAGCHVAVVIFAGCYVAMVMFTCCHVAMLIIAGCREGVPGEGHETWSRDHRVCAGAECRNRRHGNALDGQNQTHDPGISQ